MEPVRLAVLGAGLIGAKHAAMVCSHDSCVLAGVADPDPGRECVASELGAPFYGSSEELLDRTHPEGVIIATPNATHAAVAVACAERGVHMLVEKPVADTLAGAQRIVAAAREHRVSVLVGHHRRHNPLVQRARELVRGGALGQLVGFSALWTLLKPDDYFGVAWRREPPGGGPLLINLIHDLDSLRFICGEVTSVYARMSAAIRGLAVEDSLSLSLALENGALGTVLASDATPAPWSHELTSAENPAYPHVPEDCYHFVGTAASLA
ncbi:MAG: Gfo/Idh/MocA family oxidoreductase, partial [Armatimonadetes bacterium]|nr:Gfo/Idh/MocA family oxidoreductase [Armatimonadota bacterium]